MDVCTINYKIRFTIADIDGGLFQIRIWSKFEGVTRFARDKKSHILFAGWLQLINSVARISNFWCSVFWLSKGCFEEIEIMCGTFLWSSSPNVCNKAKVA